MSIKRILLIKNVLQGYAKCNESRIQSANRKEIAMGRITLKIDSQEIQTWHGATILEAALENKIYIPHLCYHPDLKPAGACRVCIVELDNGHSVASCRTPVREGMVIKTNSPEIDKVRRPVIEMIIANHHMDCKSCLKKGQCALQKIMAYMKIDKQRIQKNMRLPVTGLPVDDSNPFFVRDHNKCILCGICVRTCREIAKVDAIDFAGRGNKTKVAAFGDRAIAQSKCISCGECVIRCPVGALVLRNPRRPVQRVKSVCPYCGVGCGVYLGIKDNEIVQVLADKASSVNFGNLCVKGRFGLGFVHSPDRLKEPLIRQGIGKGTDKNISSNSPRFTIHDSRFKEASWDEALDLIARNLKKCKAEEFALIASPKCTIEDNYIAQKFARVVMGSNNIDTSERLYYSPNIAAFRRTGRCVGFSPSPEDGDGFPEAVKQKIGQIEQAACILIAGANITRSHPVLALKIKNAVDKGARLLVISPNENDLCRIAERWLKPYPGTELALIMGMCNVIVGEELFDDAFIKMYCNNFEEFRESLDDFSLGRVERITGVPRDLIEEAARVYADSKPAAIFWGSGITQFAHGTDNVHALINIAILTANIKHSLALNPLSEQSNSLGACDMGCLPDYYPCYQPVSSPDIRKQFESLWSCTLNQNPGLALTDIIDAVLAGKIKVLYIIGSNLASTFAPSKKVQAALKKAKFIIFQDLFLNETSQYAHAILPAASFAEKEGIFINTEGKARNISKALEPAGNSRPDWAILCDLANRLKHKGFTFESAENILSEILSVIHDLPETIEGFKLFPLQYTPSAEMSDMDYPLLLTTEGDIYSDGVMSEKVEGLRVLKTKNYIYINPKDADDFEISDGETIRVISRHGSIEIEVKLTGSTPSGLAFTNMEQARINQILNPVLDNISRTPGMKMCAVRIEKIKRKRKSQKKQKRASRSHV
jgi:formate dehydrogenase (NADP+) alpha subunit